MPINRLLEHEAFGPEDINVLAVEPQQVVLG